MKRFIRFISLVLALLTMLSLSSCFHDRWDIPEREDPDFDFGALLGLAGLPLSGVETMPSGIELTLSEDKSYYIVSDASGCEAEKVTIPESYKGLPIKEIGYEAFLGHDMLSEITIPSSVINVGSFAFDGCGQLKYNEYEGARYLGNEENPYHVLIGAQTSSNDLNIHENTRVIAGSAYKGNSYITKIVIPDSVVTVGERAFDYCPRVRSVVIGDGVETVYAHAFNRHSVMTELIIGSSVKTIGANAFNGAISLESLMIPDNVTEIGESAFSGCSALVKVHIGEGVRIIGDYAFSSCVGLDTVYMGNSVEVIGKNAFSLCTELESISLPHTVESISPYAFYGCSKLNYNEYGVGLYLGNPENPYEYLVGIVNTIAPTLSIHSDTRRIAQMLFYVHGFSSFETLDGGAYLTVKNNCIIDHTEKKLIAGLASSTIPTDGSVSSIADYAFYGITGLKLKTIPQSVTHIGDHAFEGCISLATITIKGPASIGDYAFAQCTSLKYVNYQEQTKSIGDYAFSNCTALSEISIPDSVEYLGRSSFENCSSASWVYIGSRVNTITTCAFSGCINLTSVQCGGSPSVIGDRAFYGCSELPEFEFKEGLKYIGKSAFYNCKKFSFALLPESLTEIGSSAFAGCRKLYTVSLGTGLKRIGDDAFGGVPTNIGIEYRGTLAKWGKIENAHNLYRGNSKLTVTCTDGEIVLEPDDVIIVLD